MKENDKVFYIFVLYHHFHGEWKLGLETNHKCITLAIKIQFSLCGLISLTQFVFYLNTDIVRVTFE